MKYPLGFNTWGKREFDQINKVLRSGNYVMGDNVRALRLNLQNTSNQNMQ